MNIAKDGQYRSRVYEDRPSYIDTEVLKKVMDVLPSEDVVEVVRCKNCKHNPNDSTDDACPFVEESGCYVKYFPENDGFCKWGERRDDE